MLAGECDEPAIEVEVRDIGRRVRRIADDQHLGPWDCVAHRIGQPFEECVPRGGRDRADRGAGDDEAEAVNGVRWVGRKNDVARRGDGLGEVGEALLRAQADNDFLVGVEIDIETPLVIGRLGLPEAGNAAARRIAMGVRLSRDLGKLFDHVFRRRSVGIAHAKIDDVLAASARRGLHRVDFGEDVGRQALDSVEFVAVHAGPLTDVSAPSMSRKRAMLTPCISVGGWVKLRPSSSRRE